jgi:hypothetical protein
MRARLAIAALCLAAGAADADSVKDNISGLESCIEAAHFADAICSKMPSDPTQRVDCFAKAQAAQLECLDRVLSRTATGAAPPVSASKTAPPKPPVDAASPQASPDRPASNQTGRADRPEISADDAGEATKPSDVSPSTAPADGAAAAEAPTQSAPPPSASETASPKPPVDAALPQASPERPAANETGQADQPEVSTGSMPAREAAKSSNASPEPAPVSVPSPATEASTGAIGSTASAHQDDRPARETDWIVSETTSPIDYSPLLTAVIHSASEAKNGPNVLAVRCRAQHIEILIRTDGTWAVPRGNDLLVDYQINDQPVVRQPWTLSADGKTATYKLDPIELLRSIPEDATLKIAVAQQGDVRLEASFALSGLSGVRQKVATACKGAPVTAKTSRRADKPQGRM